MRNASRSEPRHSRGRPVQHREGDERGLVPASLVPASNDIVLVHGDPNPNRPDLPPAIHDATGVRIRRIPFRDDRVLAALKAAGV
jgi:hypothetical protein